MTGHQQNPTTGYNIKGEPAAAVDLEAAVPRHRHPTGSRVVDPYDLKAADQAVKEELAAEEPSVIISRRPCALLKYVKHNPPLACGPGQVHRLQGLPGHRLPGHQLPGWQGRHRQHPVCGLRRVQRPVPQTGNRLKTPKARERFAFSACRLGRPLGNIPLGRCGPLKGWTKLSRRFAVPLFQTTNFTPR